MSNSTDSIPFETFAHFERLTEKEPLLYCEPPAWAAASHAIVVDDTVHYLWAQKGSNNSWVHMHSSAPTSAPTAVTHDQRNPILLPSANGFDNHAVEYPFPFWNPVNRRYYAYYLGKNNRGKPGYKQTGLLISDGDLGQWTRASDEPVVAVGGPHEQHGSSHPSAVVAGEIIHLIYTGESPAPPAHREILYNVPSICHATAPISAPENVSKDPANPVFTGSGQAWDRYGVREAEILQGPSFFHIFYGGYDGERWAIGHVRTRDFRTFEASPYNPILTPATDPDAWDCNGLLTPQVFAMNGTYYMIYAGLKGSAWNSVAEVQTGLAIAQPALQ